MPASSLQWPCSPSGGTRTLLRRALDPVRGRTLAYVARSGGVVVAARARAAAAVADVDDGMGAGRDYIPSAEELEAAIRAPPAPKFSAAFLEDMYRGRPVTVLLRVAHIGLLLGTFAATLLWDRQTGQLQSRSKQRAAQLRATLVALGPAFIKVGQALSTRPDLAPQAYLEELAVLQDSLPGFADVAAFALVEEQLGAPLSVLYGAISPTPIAAASLGQVYKATLPDGRPVAVKVQRPAILESLTLDLLLVRAGAVAVDSTGLLSTSLVGLVDEFSSRVFQELDYIQEGRNCSRFARLYATRPDVLVPGVDWRRTATKVLTLDWVDGVKLSDAAGLAARGLDVLRFVDVGIQCSLRQLLEYGYFHADPHPGNLLATSDGKLAFLDFGMMADTPPRARYAIIGHVVHLVNRDYGAMARDYYALDFLDPSVDVRPIVPALEAFFDDVLGASVSSLNFKTIVDGLGGILYQYPFRVPAYYALILRSLTVLEGLALSSDPNFKVLARAYPFFANKLLSDVTPALRDALADMLFKDGRVRWARLEGLLEQSVQSEDYDATLALRPLIALALEADTPGVKNALRPMVEAEAARVAEALLLGGAVEAQHVVWDSPVGPWLKSAPWPLGVGMGAPAAALGGRVVAKAPGAAVGAAALAAPADDAAEMLALRAVVLRCAGLLSTARGGGGHQTPVAVTLPLPWPPGVPVPEGIAPVVRAWELLSEEEAVRDFGARVVGAVVQRAAARGLRGVLAATEGGGAAAVGRS